MAISVGTSQGYTYARSVSRPPMDSLAHRSITLLTIFGLPARHGPHECVWENAVARLEEPRKVAQDSRQELAAMRHDGPNEGEGVAISVHGPSADTPLPERP